MPYEIANVKDIDGGIEKGAKYIHSKWGNEKNYIFYLDSILHSSNKRTGLPRFYLMFKASEIVGSYALITNDFISRHDLIPWLACLFIEETERGKRLSQTIFNHAKEEARKCGFDTLFLTTFHDDLYDKLGWERLEDGYEWDEGKVSKIYSMPTSY
jgi:N-acetylglutamate synthase-like GNAT family acetyltransferase